MFKEFKPHIAEFQDGTYAVRKRTLFSYEYLDNKDEYWWGVEHRVHATFTSVLETAERLEKYKLAKDKGKRI